MQTWISTLFIGIGATALVDLWAILRKHWLGIPAPDFALLGRWIAWMPRGRFLHSPIAASAAMAGERAIGWAAHYAIGVAFATLLPLLWGEAWLQAPSPGPAISVGIVTVLAPYLLMQPGMGAGVAGSKTPRPNSVRLHSLLTHAIYGVGLYLSALVAAALTPA